MYFVLISFVTGQMAKDSPTWVQGGKQRKWARIFTWGCQGDLLTFDDVINTLTEQMMDLGKSAAHTLSNEMLFVPVTIFFLCEMILYFSSTLSKPKNRRSWTKKCLKNPHGTFCGMRTKVILFPDIPRIVKIYFFARHGNINLSTNRM